MSENRTRRSNGEGTLTQRPNGRWQGRVWLPDGTRRSFAGKLRSEVVKKMAEASRMAQQGLPVPKERVTVAAFLADWLDSVQHRLKPKTVARYQDYVRLHLSALGTTYLARLTPSQVQALYSKLLNEPRPNGKKLSPTTVHHLHTVLHTALESALKKGLVARNVCDLVDAPTIRRTEMKTLTQYEAQRFLQALEASQDRFYTLYTLVLTTGMRQGELLGLTWQDVDLDRGVLTVQHNLENVRGKMRLADPKTASARRSIELTDQARLALRVHLASQLEERMVLSDAWDKASNLVFCTYHGGPLDAAHLNKSFQQRLARTQAPRIRFHDLRHTAATLAIAHGAPIKAVSEMLGHADASTTMRIYAHVTPGMRRQVVDTMNTVFGAMGSTVGSKEEQHRADASRESRCELEPAKGLEPLAYGLRTHCRAFASFR